MAEPATVLNLTASESVTLREGPEGALTAEARYGPHGKPPPMHRHPDQDERFEVLEGSVRVRAGSDQPAHRVGRGALGALAVLGRARGHRPEAP